MRTLILSFACVFTISNLFAQQSDLSFLDLEHFESKSVQFNNDNSYLKNLNSDYLVESFFNESSSIIKTWKQKLAYYNLKKSGVYDNSEKATYEIVYKNEQVDIVAIYNTEGKLLSTRETYKNIKLPLKLMVEISKAHPNYAFISNSFKCKYNHKTGIDKQYYLIKIDDGSHKKTLQVDKSFKTVKDI